MLSKSNLKNPALLLLMGILFIVTGCSGGGGNNSGPSGTTIVVGSSHATLQITNPSLQLSDSTAVSVTLKNSDGSPAAGVPVTFSTTLGTLTATGSTTGASSVTVTTDGSGVANAVLTAGSTSGQGQLTASATLENKLVTTTGLFSVNLPALKLANLRFTNNSSASISYGSSQGITVDVQDAATGTPYTAQPVDVVFTSTMAAQGKATINSPVTAIKGRATTTYTAVTASGPDTITASVSGSSQTIQLTVNPLDAGSISYVSAVPTTIGLKGMGGLGVQETSKVTFKVVDTSGAPKPNQAVNFTLNTTVGGLSLSASTGSTGPDGTVSTIVQAGTVATPIRVTASTNIVVNGKTTTVSTQSDQLVISTGIPAQNGMSLAVVRRNIEAFGIDGVEDIFTVFLADHFGNPVPDGTAINFTAQVGQIQPSCTTVNGRCAATWTSSGNRTPDGRAAIMAYAIGEETFSDPNGNGIADTPSIATCLAQGTLQAPAICGEFIDTPQAWRDDAHIGVYAPAGTVLANYPRFPGDLFIDFNGSGKVDRDGIFNGIFRPSSVTGPRTKHVFSNNVIVMSTSEATINKLDTTSIRPALVQDLGGGVTTVTPSGTAVTGSVQDVNVFAANPMPAGTQISVTSASTCLTIPATPFLVPDTTLAPTRFTFVVTNSCKTGVGSPGTVTVKVTSPLGVITSKSFDLTW
jgi:hypothetical protein